MTPVVLWFSFAAVLVVAELALGTFDLLMIALGCLVAGAVAVGDGSVELQLVAGAAVGIAATLILRRIRGPRQRRQVAPAANRDVILDIGEVIHVEQWRDRTARVRYRGAPWDAELAPGAPAAPGAHVIEAVHGSTLIVAPVP